MHIVIQVQSFPRKPQKLYSAVINRVQRIYETQCGKNKIYSVKVQNATRLALCSASKLRARGKKKENHCSSRLSKSHFTLSRAYELCLAYQRLFLAVLVNGVWHHYDQLQEFQRAGTEKMHREAVHSKWLPPLSLCVHFRKDFH